MVLSLVEKTKRLVPLSEHTVDAAATPKVTQRWYPSDQAVMIGLLNEILAELKKMNRRPK